MHYFTQQKLRGLYQSKVTFSLAAIQRPGHWVDNCKMVYWKIYCDDHSSLSLIILPWTPKIWLECLLCCNQSHVRSSHHRNHKARNGFLSATEQIVFVFFNIQSFYKQVNNYFSCYNSEEYRFERFWNKLQSRCAGRTQATVWRANFQTFWNDRNRYLAIPSFSLMCEKQNTRGNVSKISVILACYRQIGSKSTNHSH